VQHPPCKAAVFGEPALHDYPPISLGLPLPPLLVEMPGAIILRLLTLRRR
jgi:hypothetical protein